MQGCSHLRELSKRLDGLSQIGSDVLARPHLVIVEITMLPLVLDRVSISLLLLREFNLSQLKF